MREKESGASEAGHAGKVVRATMTDKEQFTEAILDMLSEHGVTIISEARTTGAFQGDGWIVGLYELMVRQEQKDA